MVSSVAKDQDICYVFNVCNVVCEVNVYNVGYSELMVKTLTAKIQDSSLIF